MADAVATQDEATQRATVAAATGAKRKRSTGRASHAQSTAAPRLQPKTLLAATRDELREIEASLMKVAEARRALLAQDKRGTKSSLPLLPPKA